MSDAAATLDAPPEPPRPIPPSLTGELPGELAAAIVAASVELVDIERDKTADAGTYSYRYADLAAVLQTVRPVLHANGLAHLQLVETDHVGNGVGVKVRTMIVHTSGATLISPPLRLIVPSTDAQRVGSAITYGRRYSLMATLGLAADDDDGAAATGTPRLPARGQQSPPPTTATTYRTPAEAQARELLNAAAPEVRTGVQRAFREHFGVSLSNLAKDRHAEALSFVIEQLSVPEVLDAP